MILTWLLSTNRTRSVRAGTVGDRCDMRHAKLNRNLRIDPLQRRWPGRRIRGQWSRWRFGLPESSCERSGCWHEAAIFGKGHYIGIQSITILSFSWNLDILGHLVKGTFH